MKGVKFRKLSPNLQIKRTHSGLKWTEALIMPPLKWQKSDDDIKSRKYWEYYKQFEPEYFIDLWKIEHGCVNNWVKIYVDKPKDLWNLLTERYEIKSHIVPLSIISNWTLVGLDELKRERKIGIDDWVSN